MKHHPQGPSRQKNFAICCGFQPTQNDHENKLLGSVCHEIWDTGDRSLADKLPDPEFAVGLVEKIQEKWCDVLQNFVSQHGLTVKSINEVFLEVPSLNFGTADKLKLTKRAALIGDAKFGRWAVEDAKDNLQGHNYAVLVWELYPDVDDIWVWFGNPFLEQYTLAKFSRVNDYPRMRIALKMRLVDAEEANPAKFKFDELNCSFCSRLDCPVREGVATAVVNFLEDRNMYEMNLEELNNIKKLTNSLKTLTKHVDDELKARVLDGGDALSDFEIKERVRSREVIGLENVNTLKYALDELCPDLDVDDIISLSFSDVEQLIVHSVGGYRQARPIISKIVEELEAAKALTTNKYYIVAAKNESEK